MNGHPRDQAKVSVHDRWPLITGTGAWQVKDATFNTPRLSPPAIFIMNICKHCHNYVCVLDNCFFFPDDLYGCNLSAIKLID